MFQQLSYLPLFLILSSMNLAEYQFPEIFKNIRYLKHLKHLYINII